MTSVPVNPEDARFQFRAKEILEAELRQVLCQTDRLFVPVLAVQWLAGMVISLWRTPLTWSGASSSIHPHVWEACVWGGAIISVPCFLAVREPGKPRTRLVIATAQALSSALLIHLMDGRIEMHFHVFASLALLAFYRDWNVLATYSSFIVVDHLLRGVWYPNSVYGTSIADPWRFVEHGSWVIIEDFYLVVFCRQSLAELYKAAARQARFEFVQSRVEGQVLDRTEAVRLNEERLQLSLKGFSVGICDGDLKDGHIYWSPRIHEMLELAPGELGDRFEAVSSLLHPDDRDRALRALREALILHKPLNCEFRLRRKSGTYCWVEGRGNSILDAAGKPCRFAGGMTDITDRKEIQEELAQRDEQLRQSQKLEAIGSLAGGIAHEFNNLLQAIRGYTLYAVRKLPADCQPVEDLRHVLDASDRAAALTRQLLGFSRHQSVKLREVQPQEVVDALLAMLRPLIGEQIHITTSIATELGAISADPVLLQQLLLNLCINARDAMPAGGQLNVRVGSRTISEREREIHSLGHAGEYVEFAVADTGTGMSPDVRKRIFDPFFTTKEVGAGTGLGLFVVYGIVQQHEGCIDVCSEAGHGTTFRILFPIVRSQTNRMSSAPQTAVICGSETILLADDEPVIREFSQRLLTEAGYHVISACNGAEALELFAKHQSQIALAVIEGALPKHSGRGVCEELWARQPLLPVVMCTGHDPEFSRQMTSHSQNFQLVQKPFDPEHLLRTIRTALDAKHQKTQLA